MSKILFYISTYSAGKYNLPQIEYFIKSKSLQICSITAMNLNIVTKSLKVIYFIIVHV